MTKSKHTKRALLVSVLSMMLCLTMLIGSTFAWFTDSVVSGKNKIVAGNLDVELYAKTGETYEKVLPETNLFMDGALWEPGHVEVVNLKVANLGTLALNYKLGINVADEKPGTNVYGDAFKLSDYIQFAVIADEQSFAAGDAGREEALLAAEGKSVKLSELAVDENGTLYPTGIEGETSESFVTLVVYMPTDVDNVANYKVGTAAPEIYLGVNLVATQAPYEEDSFNNQYDKDAAYPVTAATPAELEEAIAAAKDGDVIALTNNMTLTTPLTIEDDITINGNGKTINGQPITAKADVKFENVVLSKPDKGDGKKDATLVYARTGCENLTFEGVTFSDPQWEAIQITSADLKTLTVNNCTFTAAEVDGAATTQYGNAANQAIRYIHFEPDTRYPVVDFTITNNNFVNCDKVIAPVGIFYIGNGSKLHVCNNTFDFAEGAEQNLIFGWPAMAELKSAEKWGVSELTTYTYSK